MDARIVVLAALLTLSMSFNVLLGMLSLSTTAPLQRSISLYLTSQKELGQERSKTRTALDIAERAVIRAEQLTKETIDGR